MPIRLTSLVTRPIFKQDCYCVPAAAIGQERTYAWPDERPLQTADSTGQRNTLSPAEAEGVLHVKQRPRIYYSDSQKALMWKRWKEGWTLHQIAQLFDRRSSRNMGQHFGLRLESKRDESGEAGCLVLQFPQLAQVIDSLR